MDVIEATRLLGKAIQADERYLKYMQCAENNEKDAQLNDMIGKLNLIQFNYQQEITNAEGEPDEAKIQEYDKQFQDMYAEIMVNPSMKTYEAAKDEVDAMMNYIVNLLSMVVNGADPETCEPEMNSEGCSGDCSSCGGCH